MPKVAYLSLVVFLLASCQTRQSAPFASDSALACGSRSDHLFSTNNFCEVHNIATLELKAWFWVEALTPERANLVRKASIMSSVVRDLRFGSLRKAA